MKFRPFRFRPRTRVQAADKQRPALTRERSSRIILRRRDQELSNQDVGRSRRLADEPLRDSTAAARLLVRQRRQADTEKMAFLQEEERAQPMPNFFTVREPRQDICQTRAVRAQVLFAKGIAGRPGKSPGKGGTYKRTEDSTIQCERSI